ncbi:MAG: hypothetical protein ACTSWL_06545 [Promethearchaeota archaeon]
MSINRNGNDRFLLIEYILIQKKGDLMKLKNYQLYLVLTAIMGLSFLFMASNAKAITWIEVDSKSETNFDSLSNAEVTAKLIVNTNYPVCSLFRYNTQNTKNDDLDYGFYWYPFGNTNSLYWDFDGMTTKHIEGVGNVFWDPPYDHYYVGAWVHFSETTWLFTTSAD